MPREIIDTQSSRPAYVRRRWVTALVAIAIVVVLAFAAWTLVGSHRHETSTNAAVPGNSAH